MGESENKSVAPANAAQNESPKKEVKEPVILATKVCGVVKWFSVKNGYGFISTPSSNEDIFVHSRKIKYNNPRKLYKTLAEGETVEFDIMEGEKGHEAINVTGPDGRYVQGSQYAANKARYGDRRSRDARRRAQGQRRSQDQGEEAPKRRRRNRKNNRRGKSGSPKEGDIEAEPKDTEDSKPVECDSKPNVEVKSEENKS